MADTGDPELDALTDRYSRNRGWAKRGSYQTKLSPAQEQEFQGWLYKNNVPYDTHWPTDQSMQDYDMRGYWKAMKAGDTRAKTAIDPDDKKPHYPDFWKTPYHETFSADSIYATPDAPTWKDNRLIDKAGKVLYAPQRANLDPQAEPELMSSVERIGFPKDETPEEAAEAVKSELARNPRTPYKPDYGLQRGGSNRLLMSPEESRYWWQYANGLIAPTAGQQMTGSALMTEAQRVAPMPQVAPGVPYPNPEYSAFYLDDDAWNTYADRRAYEAIGGRR